MLSYDPCFARLAEGKKLRRLFRATAPSISRDRVLCISRASHERACQEPTAAGAYKGKRRLDTGSLSLFPKTGRLRLPRRAATSSESAKGDILTDGRPLLLQAQQVCPVATRFARQYQTRIIDKFSSALALCCGSLGLGCSWQMK